MKGYFQHAEVAITAPNGEGLSAWIIKAKALHLTYEIEESGVITLRITEEKHIQVKEEPVDDEKSKKEDELADEEPGNTTKEKTNDGSGTDVMGYHFGLFDAKTEKNEGDGEQKKTSDLSPKAADEENYDMKDTTKSGRVIAGRRKAELKPIQKRTQAKVSSQKPTVIKSISLFLPPKIDCTRRAAGTGKKSSSQEDGQGPNARTIDRMNQPKRRTPSQKPRLCSVDGCTRHGKGTIVTGADSFGPPGLRCVRHGGGNRCSINGCTVSALSHVPHADDLGPPGPRCTRHGGGNRCSVKECTVSSQGRVHNADKFGPPGFRCAGHGGGNRCSINGCTTSSKGHVAHADGFGPSGFRCGRHGGGNRCSINGCAAPSAGRVATADCFGSVGRRCYRHGGGRRYSGQKVTHRQTVDEEKL